MTLKFRDPLPAVLMRRLVWEQEVAHHELTLDDVKAKHFQSARQELGLEPIDPADRAVSRLLAKLRRAPKQLEVDGHTVHLVGWQWRDEWRLKNLAGHDKVRQLALDLLCVGSVSPEGENHRQYTVLFHDPPAPKLSVLVGPGFSVANACMGLRGIYVLHRGGKLYIGQSSDAGNRILGHKHGGEPEWIVFMTYQEENGLLSQEALTTTEALLIAFWGEVAVLANMRGQKPPPGLHHLEEGCLLAKAISAALVWLMGQEVDPALRQWSIPFKGWSVEGWPECYLKLRDPG